MALNSTANTYFTSQSFWGPVTATLDWCEANYQFSHYVAEYANTYSNLFTIGLAVYGAAQSVMAKLPLRYLVGYTGFALVGIGSFIFHATLLFEAQLMDELPMIYVASYCTAILFDTSRGWRLRSSRAPLLGVTFAVFNILFTWTYYVSRNPVYHQVVFAALMFINLFRTVYILKDTQLAERFPDTARKSVSRIFLSGAGTFAFGFLVWNLDNVYCSNLTQWKRSVGWPAAFVLEGHSWWHILTALGTYLMLIGNTYLTLCLKDDYGKFEIVKSLGLPYVHRVEIKAKQN